jgi:radical SAM protein with 4Fe4S-binding SPASM domain
VGRAKGVNDGNGFLFISHTGEIYPSGFLPLSAGNVRTHDLVDVYRESPLFRSLRDPDQLKGKCGVCEYREVCGGSAPRLRLTGDPLEAEPFCTHVPARYARMVERGEVGLRMTLTRRNCQDLDQIFDFIEAEGIERACFYHLVYSGPRQLADELTPEDRARGRGHHPAPLPGLRRARAEEGDLHRRQPRRQRLPLPEAARGGPASARRRCCR